MLDVATDHRAACIRTELVTGRSAADIYRVKTEARPAALGDASVVVRVRHLVKTYRLAKGVVLRRAIGEVRAVDGISLELRQGRTLGIVGESGSGKSTTLHEILELAAPQSGSIEVPALTSPRWGQRNADRCAATSRWSSKTRWRP